MKRTLFLLIILVAFLFCRKQKDLSMHSPYLIERIDHILLMPPSEKAKNLYELFLNELKLPIAWPYRDYGEFSTGALYFGNIPIEIIEAKNRPKTSSNIVGLALEPSMGTNLIIKSLTERNIRFDGPHPYEIGFWIFKKKMWTSTLLEDLLPGSQLFFCEYDFIDPGKERIKLDKKIKSVNGGPLGIDHVVEVVITAQNYNDFKNKLNSLLHPNSVSDTGMVHFKDGPRLQIVSGNSDKISSILIKVTSLENAKQFLISKDLFEIEHDGKVILKREKLGDILLELI